MNVLRKTQDAFGRSVQRISTGLRINSGADDPAGLAMANSMTSQIRGIRASISNIQDIIHLLRTAESGIDVVTNSVIRMRDLSIRLANRATLSSNPSASGLLPALPSDSRTIATEIKTLKDSIKQLSEIVDFNGKGGYNPVIDDFGLLYGTFAPGLQSGQVGPDNTADFRLDVVLPNLQNLVNGLATVDAQPAPNANDATWLAYATGILDLIDEKSPGVPNQYGLPSLAQARVDIGILERRLTSIVNDLQMQDINISAGRSRIMDADLAVEITDVTSNMIRQQTTRAVASQANAVPAITLQLLGSIYSGLQGGPFSGAT